MHGGGNSLVLRGVNPSLMSCLRYPVVVRRAVCRHLEHYNTASSLVQNRESSCIMHQTTIFYLTILHLYMQDVQSLVRLRTCMEIEILNLS